ncbi:MAG: hypothetical protein ACNS60_16940 [Candidatus Cyclobacteriaceae bacterium M2_1C_046]
MRWIISLAVLFPSFHSYAQITQPIRYEVELNSDSDIFHVAPDQDQDGVIVFHTNAATANKYVNWRFFKLNDSLQEEWSLSYLIDHTLLYHQHKVFKSHLFILLKSAITYDYKVLVINIESGVMGFYEIKSYIPVSINSFEITNRAIFLGGSYNSRPIVLLYYFNLNRTLLLPNLYTLEGDLHHISPNKNSFDVVVSRRVRKNTLIHVYTFDYEGKMLSKDMLFPDGNMSFQNGKIIGSGNYKFLIGTYGFRRSEYSRGFYVADLKDNKNNIKFYNYGDLENFFNFMKEKKVKRIKKRIVRRKEAGKSIKFNYRLQIHNIKEINGELVVLGEAFYPHYKNQTNYSSFSRRSLYTYGNDFQQMRFDGYRYTHAVIVGISKDGDLLWDNSFEINDVENSTLQQVVQVAQTDRELLLCYNYNNYISSKIIREDQVLKIMDPIPISLMHQEDKLKKGFNRDKGGVIKGNGNTFYAYGIQKIKNLKDEEVKLNREVFFVNKVIYK